MACKTNQTESDRFRPGLGTTSKTKVLTSGELQILRDGLEWAVKQLHPGVVNNSDAAKALELLSRIERRRKVVVGDTLVYDSYESYCID